MFSTVEIIILFCIAIIFFTNIVVWLLKKRKLRESTLIEAYESEEPQRSSDKIDIFTFKNDWEIFEKIIDNSDEKDAKTLSTIFNKMLRTYKQDISHLKEFLSEDEENELISRIVGCRSKIEKMLKRDV